MGKVAKRRVSRMEATPQGVPDDLCDEVREYMRLWTISVTEFLITGASTQHPCPQKSALSKGAQLRLAAYQRRLIQDASAQEGWSPKSNDKGTYETVRAELLADIRARMSREGASYDGYVPTPGN